ncbi:MAG: hypothetical protein AAFY88_32475 [Acidobacteriota bacterium]
MRFTARALFVPVLLSLLLPLLLPDAASAALSRDERKAIKKILKKADVLYMRTDAPCVTGRHDFGVFVKPLVKVSTRDISIADGQTLHVGLFHTSSTYWGIRINDPVEFDEMDYDDDDAVLEIELEGVDTADGERTVIELTGIHTMEDFDRAFDLAFSRRPLQDHHDDWSAEVKSAIADRHFLDGMSKRQVYYIVGEPQHIEVEEVDGKSYETWLLRTDRGLKSGFVLSMRRQHTNLPAKIHFVDGELVGTERRPGSLNLDD